MITAIVSIDADARRARKAALIKQYPHAIVFDDASITADVLRAHAYPSLFETATPTVIAPFALEAVELAKPLAQELAASPTLFFFLERSVGADAKKLLTAYGSLEILDQKGGLKKAQSSLFYDASALVTETNKLKRWQKLQTLLQSDVPEAFIGIMYWKLRDLATKAGAKKENYKKMYDALINAHATAWINGTPLANAIEKVLLTF